MFFKSKSMHDMFLKVKRKKYPKLCKTSIEPDKEMYLLTSNDIFLDYAILCQISAILYFFKTNTI